MKQLTFDYQCADDAGVSQLEEIPILIPVGGTFKCEYGTYQVTGHHIAEKESPFKQYGVDKTIVPYCERISTDHL